MYVFLFSDSHDPQSVAPAITTGEKINHNNVDKVVQGCLINGFSPINPGFKSA